MTVTDVSSVQDAGVVIEKPIPVDNKGPSPFDAGGLRYVIGLDREELAEVFRELGEPEKSLRMRANQLWHWIYHRGATDFSVMTTIARGLQEKLAGACTLDRGLVENHQQSSDGTAKWLVRKTDGALIESVFIPEEDRGTLCVSSQVGCTLNCSFCHTGTQAWVRNLGPREIVSQIMIARDGLGEWPTPTEGRKISNIVMMGMGEPLYNLDNVGKALRVVMDGEGLSISKRRITLSTAGVVPMMDRCGEELDVNLAVSLHAVSNDVRDELVPLNRKYPISELLAACKRYPGSSNARRITFEYVMLKGVNDSPADARELVRLLKGIPAKINLIPFNPWPGVAYECSDWQTIRKFSDIVFKAGYSSPIRMPRGRDIMAACGQLKSATVKQRASER
jgi:23S rRNA (adenine2503-C2)-methyltransferase